MKIATILAKIADSIVSIGLLLVGCYLFFFEQIWITGALVIAVHSFYQVASVYCLKTLKIE
jgi:CHASE2 domain-containing sensor protein